MPAANDDSATARKKSRALRYDLIGPNMLEDVFDAAQFKCYLPPLRQVADQADLCILKDGRRADV
jgi:hypothetical protein